MKAWVLPDFRIFSRMLNHVSWSEADPEDTCATRMEGRITVMVITHRTTGPTGRLIARKIDLREISANVVHCSRDEIHVRVD
jgi:hypothetical protein